MPKEDKPMFTPMPTCEAYNPDGGKPRVVLRGPVPPRHMQRPVQLTPKGPDYHRLGMYVPSDKPKDSLTVKRCPVCGARWVEPTESCPCDCPKK